MRAIDIRSNRADLAGMSRNIKTARSGLSPVDAAYAIEHHQHSQQSTHTAELAMLWAAVGYFLGWLTWGM